MTGKHFALIAELITHGTPGDYCTEYVSSMRSTFTHLYREPLEGPEGATAALIDTVCTAFFEESYSGTAVKVYRSSFTTSGRAVGAGTSYSRLFTRTDFEGLPERITHGESARFSKKTLETGHAVAVAAYAATRPVAV